MGLIGIILVVALVAVLVVAIAVDIKRRPSRGLSDGTPTRRQTRDAVRDKRHGPDAPRHGESFGL